MFGGWFAVSLTELMCGFGDARVIAGAGGVKSEVRGREVFCGDAYALFGLIQKANRRKYYCCFSYVMRL